MVRIFRKLQPEDVFTPRVPHVNKRIYVHRSELERALVHAIKGPKHFCIFGESGNGKSWLYKKVFSEYSVNYRTVNLSHANMNDSLLDAFLAKIASIEEEQVKERTTKTSGSFNPGGMGGGVEKTTTTVPLDLEPVERLFRLMKGTARKPSILVLDNFETIEQSENVIRQISNVVMLLDDEDYGKYHVKLCIVGVPLRLREYIAKQSNRTTILNRLVEVPEVSRMTPAEAREVLERGFEELLGLEFLDEKERERIYKKVLWVSDRIASEVQDLGLRIATEAFSNDGVIETEIVEEVVSDWLASSYNSARITIEERLNKKGVSKAGRRSQCLYCLGLLEFEDFLVSDVTEMFHRIFPSTRKMRISISRLLNELCQGENAPVRKIPTGEGYRFSHPKYRMAIRATLVLRDGERVDLKRNVL